MKHSKAVLTVLFCTAAVIGYGQTPPAKTKPDNTKVNQRDRNAGEATADQQKTNATDQELTRNIRRSIMADKALSTYAHNIKIISRNGSVTLKGPVKSEAEKKSVVAKAVAVAGSADKVTDQCRLSIRPSFDSKELNMADKKTAVFGIYKSGAQAERAVDQIIAAGFSNNDISVLLPDKQSSKEFAHEKNTKAPEGTAAGVTTGGVVGGTLGLLAGIGALAIPGLGPFIAAGPIMAGLAGLGVGGAVGGLIGALVGMGIPEYEAKRYEGRVKEGGVLLSVHCDTADEISRAKDLLKATGAEDISSAGEKAVGGDAVPDQVASSKF